MERDAVALVAVTFGLADQIQPVTSPALTVGRTGEQIVNQALELAGVFEEGFLFGERGRESDEVQIYATEQRARVGWRGGFPATGLQLFENERVDGIGAFHIRSRGARDRLKSPVVRSPFNGQVGDLPH